MNGSLAEREKHGGTMDLIDIKSMTPQQIERFCAGELGQRPGRGLRTAALLFKERIVSFEEMTGLNRGLREQLRARCSISQIRVDRTEQSDDGTAKLLYRLGDGNAIEGVLIPGPHRLTLCLSTQVGCASGCRFCLTGGSGLIRNLTASEIVNQLFAAEGHAGGRAITNLVLMGTGEPLSNYDAVRAFVETATDGNGLGFSPKRVTISTCGLAPQIERLADDGVSASLAVSLNATTDEVRDRIMPVNRVYPLERLLQAIRYYCESSGKTVTIEYVLFGGVNDDPADARRLVELLDGLPCMVNLLLFNPFPGSDLLRPGEERLRVFRDMLVSAGIIAVVRKSRGRDISAACGQLRATAAAAPPKTS